MLRTDIDEKETVRLYTECKSLRQIGKIQNADHHLIGRILARHGLKIKDKISQTIYSNKTKIRESTVYHMV